MKHILFILSAALVCSSSLFAQSSQGERKNNWMKDQRDQTDTYAIPLDSSEEEEDEEERALNKYGQKKESPSQKCEDGKCRAPKTR